MTQGAGSMATSPVAAPPVNVVHSVTILPSAWLILSATLSQKLVALVFAILNRTRVPTPLVTVPLVSRLGSSPRNQTALGAFSALSAS